MPPTDADYASTRRFTSFTPSGASVSLQKSLPFEQTTEQPGHEAAWILDCARAFIEPRALDVRVCFRSVEEPYLDADARPAHATWRLRRSDVSREQARATIRPQQERIVSEVDAAALGGVLADALAQTTPPDRRITFESFTVQRLRARVLRPTLVGEQALTVWRGQFERSVPIVKDERGAWIDEYADDLDPPLELHVDNNDGAVRAKLLIGWSLWSEEGSAEHAAVVAFGRSLIARGYDVDRASPAFVNWL